MRWRVVVAFLLFSLLVVATIKLLPEALATGDLKGKDRAEEIGRVRTAILATLAGVLAAIGAYYTHRTFELNRATLQHNQDTADRSHALDQARLITERFTRAIDQLGAPSLDIRLGGVYALERIARDSAADHPQVVEVLTAYVREHARWAPQESVGAATHEDQPEKSPDLPTDVQAAMSVLGRRTASQDRSGTQLNLAYTDLRGVVLQRGEAHLEQAILTGVRLDGARLHGAELKGADLRGTDLRGADLTEANLTEADLTTRANLEQANLRRASLRGADLAQANLEQANLTQANLTQANLTQANLKQANLTQANLKQANVERANLRQSILEQADLEEAKLRESYLTGARLDGANLTGAYLKGAGLRRAYLRRARLERAHLQHADLTDAHINGAHLERARLHGASLARADLRGAVKDDNTTWPMGFDPQAAGTRHINDPAQRPSVSRSA